MSDKDQLWKLKRYYEKVLIDYYSTNEIDPDMANRIVGGLTRFMNITEQQQQEIEKLTRIAAEADEGCEYWKDRYKQAQAKIERYRDVLEWYAHPETYKRAGNGEYVIMMDKGWNAKQALDNDEGRNENMRKVRFTLSMNLVGCKREEVMEFDDDMTDEEIQEQYEQWREEQLDGGWEEID